jgi:hypothetical protein
MTFAHVRVALILAAAGAVGCSSGVHWRGIEFNSVHAASRREQKLTFVYMRSPYLVECTRFEDAVLLDPAVRGVLNGGDFNPVPLDFSWDWRLAERWGLERPPAYAIVGPDDELLAHGFGEITVAQLLDALNGAKQRFAEKARASSRSG